MYQEIQGDLIELALQGMFDAIIHGVNGFCNMGAGLAPQMVKAFNVDKYPLEGPETRGDINKLGQIDWQPFKLQLLDNKSKTIYPVNAYTQYRYGRNHKGGVQRPLDYEALTLCMRKISQKFDGMHIGLPQIGAGLAGGDWNRIKAIIQDELYNCDVTIVIYNK